MSQKLISEEKENHGNSTIVKDNVRTRLAIICPNCGDSEGETKDSRPIGESYRRRRKKCYKCGHKWTTIEFNMNCMNALEDELENAIVGRDNLNLIEQIGNLCNLFTKTRRT